MKIACDPVLCPAGTIQDYGWFRSRRLNAPVYVEEDFHDVDLWLITHAHADHLDTEGLAQIRPGGHVVTHASALSKIRRTRAGTTTVLAWHQQHQLTIRGVQITVEAMPAIHGIHPISAWFAGGVNGYWVTVSTTSVMCSFYVTGDTVTAKPLLKALEGRRVGLLIPYMGAAKQGNWIMTLTLSARMLKVLQHLLAPTVTIPVHFGTFEHYVEPIAVVEQWRDDTIRILQPGQRCQLAVGAT